MLDPNLTIDKIETFPLYYALNQPYGDANGLKRYRSSFIICISTRSGITGFGECIDWLPALKIGFERRIIPYLIGKNALERTQITQTIQKWHKRSAAAVSMALMEIISKNAGVSVCNLWGGKLRNQLPVYASFQSYFTADRWQAQSLHGIEKAMQEGYRNIKIKVGGKPIEEDQQHVLSVLRLLDDRSMGIAVDANQSYDTAAALRWQKIFDQSDRWMWFEEPIPDTYIDEYARLRERLSMPICGGENMESTTDFIPFLQQHALDIITPDPQHLPEIDQYRAVTQLIRSFDKRISPHSFDGALSRLYAAFVQACLTPWSKMDDNPIEPIEWDMMDNPFTNLLNWQPSNGLIHVPDGIGIGVDIDMEKLTHYKWDGGNLG